MSLIRTLLDYLRETAFGTVGTSTALNKFGRFSTVGAAEEDIWDIGGLYSGFLQAATTVRIKLGGAAADTAAGANAQEITVSGLDGSLAPAEEAIATNGALASLSTTTTFFRVFRAWVSKVGTYGATNAGDIVIENTAGTADLAQISLGFGQTEMAIYTVPANTTLIMDQLEASVASTKTAQIRVNMRQNADDIVSPMSAKRVVRVYDGVTGTVPLPLKVPLIFPAKTDVWISANAGAGGAAISAMFDGELRAA